MRESDLYGPVKKLLEAQGYEVKGEVEGCDVVALRAQEAPVVVELKLNLNLEVILQAVDRLQLTSKVYIGVPRRCRVVHRRRKQVLKLMRMLGLGLLLVDRQAEVLLDPGEYRPRRSKHRRERLLAEFALRVGDPNLGGSDRRGGVMTSYRQRALALASYLNEHGPTKAALMARELEQPKAREVLYNNVYGWFERVSRGVYELSPRGKRELPEWVEDPSE